MVAPHSDVHGVQPGNTASGAPIADEAVRRQVARLFGETLFGAWPELEQSLPKRPRRLRWKAWTVRLLAAGLVAGVVFGGGRLMQPGLKRQVDDQRDHYANELQSFLSDGDLGRTAQFTGLLRGNAHSASGETLASDGKTLDPKDPYLDLIVNAEATLYRYFDADPERLQRIQPYLENAASGTPMRLIAALTVLSREERAARLPELDRLHNDLPNRNELEYLLATALEFRNDAKAAREAWERSERLGPAWLNHRFEQAWFELHQNRQPAAQKLAKQIVRIDPESGWSKLAHVTFSLPQEPSTSTAASIASVRAGTAPAAADTLPKPIIAPVEQFFEKLLFSIEAARRNDLHQADEGLVAAATLVHHQPPFLLDAFDWLMAEKLPAVARKLTLLSSWPKSPLAEHKVARLALGSETTVSSNPPPATAKLPRPPRFSGHPAAKQKAARRGSTR